MNPMESKNHRDSVLTMSHVKMNLRSLFLTLEILHHSLFSLNLYIQFALQNFFLGNVFLCWEDFL